ncbi:M90 family metallopeptidase [Undibacterium crateris]|uniref:M90 family metallopeptidase n=1 Tax=Undibacterium crateris TaxID=2528175 RepID=UPI001389DDEE|nr:M90 family metallopeptidase [Undibacterium crateris]NDI84417.1 hypothetical protein [Undibacterium crateris]
MWWIGCILISVICALVLVPKWRLHHVLGKAFPLPYSKILRRNLPGYSRMPTDLQMQLKRRIRQFLFQKKFVGCDGLQVTDEMRVTIAGRACLLLLNRETEVYPELSHILLYPGVFVAPRSQMLDGGVVTHTNQGLSGESWSDGRVILAWDQIVPTTQEQAAALAGQDVVLHEFAHQLDSESGSANGAPVLAGKNAYAHWSDVMQRVYVRLQHALSQQQETVLDPYGATSPAEFFAVATEAFFRKSQALAAAEPELYGLLRRYYRVDPLDWL